MIPWCERVTQGARNWARRRDNHERRRRASLGEHPQQIKGGRVCPMEIFEGDERQRAPRKQPGGHRG